MVTLFCFSSVFSLEMYHLLPSDNCFNNIAKAKYRTAFSKLLKGYICHIFSDIMRSKITRSSKIYIFKKIKGFIGYGDLQNTYLFSVAHS